jgi:hypothetical protein
MHASYLYRTEDSDTVAERDQMAPYVICVCLKRHEGRYTNAAVACPQQQ